MAQIQYCDDEIQTPSWHPIFSGELCAEVRQDDEWGLVSVNQLGLAPWVDDDDDVCMEKEFQQLASRWKRETAIYGHLTKIIIHPDYQRIMAMGPQVIPLILQDLSKQSAHWFWALHNLVRPGQDPAEGLTTMSEARRAWLEWGRNNDYL